MRLFILAQLLNLEGAVIGERFTFIADTTLCGWGEAKFDVVYRGTSLPHSIREVEDGIYHVTFTPQDRGKHRIYVYYNGIEVKGITQSGFYYLNRHNHHSKGRRFEMASLYRFVSKTNYAFLLVFHCAFFFLKVHRLAFAYQKQMLPRGEKVVISPQRVSPFQIRSNFIKVHQNV